MHAKGADTMTPSPIHLLTETVEHDSLENLTSDQLAKMAETPASELFVWKHGRECWVRSWIRRFRITLAFALGAMAAIQAGGYFLIKSALRDSVRAAVLEVLKERHLADVAPLPERMPADIGTATDGSTATRLVQAGTPLLNW
jgi:hypothetical protein